MRRPQHSALPLVAVLLLAGCGGGTPSATPSPDDPGSASVSGSPSPSGAGSGSASAGSPSPAASTSSASVSRPAPGPLEPTTDLLDWQPVPGGDGASVTTNGTWSVTVPQDGRTYRLGRGEGGRDVTLARGFQVADTLLSDRWAVVAAQDEQGERPQVATVVDLRSGERRRVDGTSEIPTTYGGEWALDGDRLGYATLRGQDYCLAVLDLASGDSSLGPCVGAREGYGQVHLGPAGDALLRFDLGKPSCRTVVSVEGTALTPFPGVPDCHAAEGLLLDTPAGPARVWSVVPDERRFEEVEVHARIGDDVYDLGNGSNGTLVACGGAAYFSQDAQSGDGRARLLRFDGTALAVVYESQPGQAVLSAPRCGGEVITVSSYAESGDEQVSAPLG